MSIKNVTLPSYTKKEEIINSISHAIGIIIGIVAIIILAVKSTSGNELTGSIVFALSTIFLYLSSTLYHSLPYGNLKKIFRLLDHSVIYVLISGTVIALSIICFYNRLNLLLIAVISVCLIISITGILLTLIDHEKYKKIQLILYLALGWGAALLVFPLYKYCNNFKSVILLILAGGILYTVGTIFYVIGKKKRYFHSIFHIFVLSATVLHLLGIYVAL